jgi:CDP-glucose 4,6-dehydratase
MFGNIFKNKIVLITGNTGFKGSWLTIWMLNLGAKVIGVALDPPSSPSLFENANLAKKIKFKNLDIRNFEGLKECVLEEKPDFIFHMAAQSLVRPSYDHPIKTVSTNLMGTINILETLRFIEKKIVVVMVTSDKVYENIESLWGYKETDTLGGKDLYSSSKAMAELAINSYFHSFFREKKANINIGIGRAGNVIGGGDWAEDRLIPDCIKSWSMDKRVIIRNPQSTRPWQHVLEPLSGYMTLASNLYLSNSLNGEAYNFGPNELENFTVERVIAEMSNHWDKVDWQVSKPNQTEYKEAGLLKLNCEKSFKDLNWTSNLTFNETIKMTIDWYKYFFKKNEMYNFTNEQIESYCDLAKKRDKIWKL